MNEDSVGKNIRAIRKQKMITLQELADRTGLTKSYVSKIERSKKAPPYTTVNRIAMALEVEVAHLLSENLSVFSDIRLSLTKKNRGKIVETLGSSYGYKYEALGYTKPGKNMQPFIVQAAFNEKNIFQHEGEEFIYVLEGRYQFFYDGKEYIMEEGDSVYFDSGVPHSARSLGKKKAKILAIMYNYKRL
jgi:transcriptional regulator with XRE-family HTH domain